MNIIMSLLLVLQIPDTLFKAIPGYYCMYSHFVPDSVVVFDTMRNRQFNNSEPQALHIPDFLVNDDNYQGSGADQYFSDAAVDGQGNFWVAWCDNRNGDYDTYLSRYDAQGNPLGPNIRVNDDQGFNIQRWPAVTANNNGAIVAWFESSSLSGGNIYYQKFDASGNKIGVNKRVNDLIDFASGDYGQSLDLDVNSSGKYIIAWVDHRMQDYYGDDIYMQLFDETGNPVGSNVRVNDDFASWWFPQQYPTCGIDEEGKSIVAWQDTRLGTDNARIYAQGFTAMGQPINTNFIVYSNRGFMPQICMVGLNTAVITLSGVPSGGSGIAIYAYKYDISGTPIIGPVQVNEDFLFANRHPNISYNYNGSLVITWWGDDGVNYNLFFQRLNTNLTLIGDNIQINNVSGGRYADIIPGIAFNESVNHVFFVWSDGREEPVLDTYGSIYEYANGEPVTDNFKINDDQGAISQGTSNGPSVNASCSDRHVVVWMDMRTNFNCNIYGQLYNGTGNQIGGNFRINEAEAFVSTPAVAMANNGDFIVAYQFGSYIYARRYNRDGVSYGPSFRVDDTPPGIGGCYNPAVDYDEAGKFVIVWEDYRAIIIETDYIGLQCFDNNGIPQGANILLGTGLVGTDAAFLYQPGVAINNSNQMQICCFGVQPNETNLDIISWHREYGQTSPQQAPIIINNNTQNSQQLSTIATNGSNFLIVWLDDNDGDWRFDVMGQRLNNLGSPQGTNFNITERINPNQYFEWATLCSNLSGGYIVTWADNTEPDWNVYAQGISSDGELVGTPIRVNNCNESFNYNHQINPGVSSNGSDIFFIWEDNRRHKSYDIYGNFMPRSTFWITDDPLSLAYNGNRHLVREPNTLNLHLVYTDQGHVLYRNSSDGGDNWSACDIIGNGAYPAITLDIWGYPCVTWVNTSNQLCYAHKDFSQTWTTTSYSFGTSVPSHPCIVATHLEMTETDSVHIIVRLYDNGLRNNSIREIAFSIFNPQSYNSYTIDNSSGHRMVTLDFPSAAADYDYKLHASWMRGDTVSYGSRAVGQTAWYKNKPFSLQGRNSSNPFIEAYGDSIFIVWQNLIDNEIWRGSKHLQFPTFYWANLSLTPSTPSTYPVNASGLVTTFVDKVLPSADLDIFWKTYPGQPLHNISNTSTVKSIYPHTSLMIPDEQDDPIQYVVWQEGNSSPYVIHFDQIPINSGRLNSNLPISFYSTIPGLAAPSLHLAERDSFISGWRIPVDIGRVGVKYRFPMNPKCLYKMKFFAYQEYGNTWSMNIDVDGLVVGKINYNANKLESLEVWIPPDAYRDSTISIIFKNDNGNYAAVGPLYIYQYEVIDKVNKGCLPGGVMSINNTSSNGTISLFPNPFKQNVHISLQSEKYTEYCIKAYDISGRLVANIFEGRVNNSRMICWNGSDNNGRSVPIGLYFLTIKNINTGKVEIEKILRIR